MTSELEGYKPLDSISISSLSAVERKMMFESLAATLRPMHEKNYQHSNLYPKHIFIKINENGTAQCCLIDLEKTRRRLFSRYALVKDLDILNRHIEHISQTDRLRFFLAYTQEKKLSRKSKKTLRKILGKKR